ncbi:TPA: abortive infection family protein [Klebsiella pneumoniae]|uniref:abortive infection family protein n=1 Tax=Klebsiella pneumoniae TaxID=573 RepID=UPI002152F4BB|nr:abortive infection family protein [Klebsiella pneumoniae]EKW2177232.1 abortive infection family protein [Klebsiella pneumoniae]HBV3471826.1 abortive infection family protein [Klebsiella pneumoniae]HBV6351440.1 abortive infection family protein [Klebsiella pneumoniae]HDN2583895.1 abortive infection family protein [Klebsiella pneumoniae]HDN2594859.1 abortive infection family protein [Klebsiella pneumoniae]
MNIIDTLQNDLERAAALQNIMIARATGAQNEANSDYVLLRAYFLQNQSLLQLLPDFVRTNHSLKEFWGYIKKTEKYDPRREIIYKAFQPLFDYLEGKNKTPADEDISNVLMRFDEDSVHTVWTKALERRHTDPDGAITSARTLLETVCKHILDDMGVAYNNKNIEMSELYKILSKELNLSADQHTESIFKQILGGCSAVVNGLGTLRNKLGDAHGKNRSSTKPSPRHAELAVNLSGSMALFLTSTWLNLKEKS